MLGPIVTGVTPDLTLGRALHAILVSGKKAQDGQQDDLDANAHVMEVQRERPIRAGTSHRSPVRIHVHIGWPHRDHEDEEARGRQLSQGSGSSADSIAIPERIDRSADEYSKAAKELSHASPCHVKFSRAGQIPQAPGSVWRVYRLEGLSSDNDMKSRRDVRSAWYAGPTEASKHFMQASRYDILRDCLASSARLAV